MKYEERHRAEVKKSQHKRIENGKCRSCPLPLKTKTRCSYHAKRDREYERNWQCNRKEKRQELDRIRHAKKESGQLWEHHFLCLTIRKESWRIQNG